MKPMTSLPVLRRTRRIRPRRIVLLGLTLLSITAASGCHPILHWFPAGGSVPRPPADAFGPGPRASEAGLYRVTLEPDFPLQPRVTRTVQVRVQTEAGEPVQEARIAVDGWMPDHAHGLPTRPRAVPNGAPGLYDIEGLRFNMGGWWELRLVIEGGPGTDTVVFNLNL